MSFDHNPHTPDDLTRTLVMAPQPKGSGWAGRLLLVIALAAGATFLGFSGYNYWKNNVKDARLSSITLFGKTFELPGANAALAPPLASLPAIEVANTPPPTATPGRSGTGGGGGQRTSRTTGNELLVYPLPPTADGKPVDSGPPKPLPTAELAGAGGIARIEVGRTAQQQAEAAAAVTQPADRAAECDLLRARNTELDAMVRQPHSPRVLEGLKDERKRATARLGTLRC
jgi:hypothetical protein